MNFKKFGSRYVVRLDKGDEIVSSLKQFCTENNIRLGSITGIGAANSVTIGLFETASKQYHSNTLTGDYEITSLNGNVSSMNNEVYLHLHISISDSAYKAYGGHLTSAVISGTCELLIDTIDGTIERQFDEDTGLNIYNL